MKIRIEKLQKELARGKAMEQYAALKSLRSFVAENLLKEQSQVQSTFSGLQDLINELGSPQPSQD